MLQHRPWQRPCLLAGNLAAVGSVLATRFQNPWLIGATAIMHAGYACAVGLPRCGWFGPVITHFVTPRREVWLTIDDGPSGKDSFRLGDALAERGVRATFFVKGENLVRTPEVARHWLAAGHTLANHTHTHPSHRFAWISRTRLRAELDDCAAALREAGAPPTRWFRAPVGLKSPTVHPELAARGWRLIAWNVRGHDGLLCEPEGTARRVLAGAAPGAIILLHEGHPRSVEGILRVADGLRDAGFTFTVPDDADLR